MNSRISYQANTWSEITSDVTIETTLNEIRSDKYKNQIENLRSNLEKGNKEYYDSFKKQLPAVTFSATFNVKRTKENLKNYNSIIVLDIDKLDDLQLKNVYNKLINDEYVFSFWRSPSNKGYKGLVIIDYKIENQESSFNVFHKIAFNNLSEYFLKKHNIELDKSGSDITRLCFLSYDNNLVKKLSCKRFEIFEEDIIAIEKSNVKKNAKLNFVSNLDALHNPAGKNNQFNRKLMTDIIRYLRNKNLSITYDYEDWCKTAMAITNTFTYDVGLKYFLNLSAQDFEKYNQIICTNFLINCYETRLGNINFSSIVYLANQKGFKTKYQKNGVPKAED